jgi:hypothetical protein
VPASPIAGGFAGAGRKAMRPGPVEHSDPFTASGSWRPPSGVPGLCPHARDGAGFRAAGPSHPDLRGRARSLQRDADTTSVRHMENLDSGATFTMRATAVRLILQGIYDKDEREFVLRFVADAEDLASQASPGAVKASAPRAAGSAVRGS